ncbi:GDSL-type esterase/lipase family protein [bacterium]|nr:GDSL-type esterase/lipase family protein [bacterium]
MSCNSNPEALIAEPKLDQWWQDRHQEILSADKSNVDIVFLGDSITHNWEKNAYGFSIWQQYYGDKAFNMGFGGDRTQHLLWRIENGELNNVNPKYVVLLIGTNNAPHNHPDDTAKSIKVILEAIQTKLPQSIILLHRIFPRSEAQSELRLVNEAVNQRIKAFSNDEDIIFVDIYDVFIDRTSKIPRSIMPDGVHPSTKGYEIWADELSNFITL